MEPTDAAWAAGFIDGEGSFTIQMRDGTYVARLAVAQLSRRPLDKLQTLFGGNVHPAYANACSVYEATYTALDSVLLHISPYLIVKKLHAVVVREFRETQLNKNYGRGGAPDYITQRRRRLYDTLHELNKPESYVETA